MTAKVVKGEVTAFLSLVFLLLLTFIGGVMESASIQVSKNYKKANMDLAMESVFAEYQRDLLEHYEVFALDGTYETGNAFEKPVKDRLNDYGASGMEQEITRVQLLTDQSGKAFYDQAMHYMAQKTGTEKLQGVLSNTAAFEEQEKFGQDYEEVDASSAQQWQEQLSQIQTENPEAKLPPDEGLTQLSNLKSSALLEQIVPKEMVLSNKKVQMQELVSHRELQNGWGVFSDQTPDEGAFGSLLYGAYLLDHFPNAVSPEEAAVLSYESEYLLAGKESDRENLEAVAKKLRVVRFGANYGFLLSSSVKQAEAQAMALTMATVIALPQFTELVKHALLLGWAYGESIVDLRSLLKGNRVPLIKTEENWQLSLTGLFSLGTGEGETQGADTQGGLPYKEYLRILLFLEQKETLTMRALDLVEQNMQIVYGKSFFRADACISKLEIASSCKLRRRITYDFKTAGRYR